MFTGDQLSQMILTILGNVFIVIFAYRAIQQYAQRDWGDMLTSILAAILVAGIIWFPDTMIEFLKAGWQAL